ncbi:hypothetical protein P8452_51245 [Trifolium repens]|nr:hypothetical protein P8452_51245 [Trifolium repens]
MTQEKEVSHVIEAEVEAEEDEEEEEIKIEIEDNDDDIDCNNEEEKEENEKEDEEEKDDDELRKRVEEFIEKVNKKWKEELLSTSSLVNVTNMSNHSALVVLVAVALHRLAVVLCIRKLVAVCSASWFQNGVGDAIDGGAAGTSSSVLMGGRFWRWLVL